jgi:AcrR family transcriptional regulator
LVTSSEPVVVGRRERGKVERRRRIEEAARFVFREKGFEAATTREIAERADVGVGTLFAYVRDKQDLLMMVFNERLDKMTDESFATIDAAAPLLAQCMHIFTPRYELWGEDPDLSRYAVQESFAILTRQDETLTEAAHFLERRFQLHGKLAELVAAKQRSGAVNASTDPRLIATLILDIFLSETRGWLVDRVPVLDDGLERLRRVLSLAIDGIIGQKSAAAKSTGRSSASKLKRVKC